MVCFSIAESLATVKPVKTIKCDKQSCPPAPFIGSAICRPVNIAGQCCPSYSCVSSNPPSINVCEVSNSYHIFKLSSQDLMFCFVPSRKLSATRTSTVKFKLKKATMGAGCRLSVSALQIPLPFHFNYNQRGATQRTSVEKMPHSQ